jgi:pyruvate carboxylase
MNRRDGRTIGHVRCRMISKVLVANCGEIAVRAFRAAYELGIASVAVYPYEDRNSPHRLADEAYQVGVIGNPVRAYLSVDEIVATARRAGADAIYPGYGFLSENPDLAAACAAANITFIGPSADVLELTGNKSRAIAAARETGLPVLDSSPPSASVEELLTAAATMRFPLFVKAVFGGDGRDRSIASAVPVAEKADHNNPEHIAAPFADVVTMGVTVGDTVRAGQTVATIEAMKMEAAITAPNAGTVAVSKTGSVEGGDLVVVVTPPESGPQAEYLRRA